jgi:hypothetical protein
MSGTPLDTHLTPGTVMPPSPGYSLLTYLISYGLEIPNVMSTVAVVWLALTLVAVTAALSWKGDTTLMDVVVLSSAAARRRM